MKKVLCGTDHSEVAKKAEVFAANWAKNFGAELTYAFVSHITEQDMGPKARRSSMNILKDVALQENEVLSHAKKVAEEAGITEADCVLLRSHKIARTLVDYAKKNGVDHIVIGASDREGLPLLGLGSVATKIIHGASCPVTVIR